MPVELNLRFADADQVEVRLDGVESGSLPFSNPFRDRDRDDLRWYVETYGAHSLGDPDDAEAARIRALLPVWGKRLFDAVFEGEGKHAARRLFDRFQDAEDDARLLTISAEHPAILALPWELLHETGEGEVFLFRETPRISVRRTIAGATLGRKPFAMVAKERLHLLFVVSRPEGTSFLDPRADPGAVLDALDEHAPGRVSWEFLRPPTLDALVQRLEDTTLPPVEILHFDGHGIFDREGGLPGRFEARQGSRSPSGAELLRGAATGSADESEHPPNTGYLLFEKEDVRPDFVSAEKLGANLHRHRVSLVVLSACQSAAIGEDDEGERPMGSVAARLTATGIPSVLAMTHSVLVPTTRALFGELYKQLSRQKSLGEALDNARGHLFNNPEKYEVQRGPDREWLKLYDWFLPALYQSGDDGRLLAPAPTASPRAEDLGKADSPPAPSPRDSGERAGVRGASNLPPAPEAGFFGRRRELWQIERAFAAKARRITVTGFGGQGKTALALEAGRWLTRTGQFQAAVLVDYSRFQGLDAAHMAVTTLGSVLGESLLDASAATELLRKIPTLVILDNLESLAPEPLQELLDAAVAWSEAGGSRVLCTTRRPEFGHAQYRVQGTLVHQRIQLDGLGSRRAPADALEWFAELSKLPPAPTLRQPKREELIDLFDRVRFHPLSIRVLAQQLKTRSPTELGERLEHLLAAGPSGDGSALNENTPAGLLASLELSLDRLDEGARRLLPRLGVFQGGAMENMLVQIAEIAEGEWSALRARLEAAALIEAEDLPGVSMPFLRFHPTLAPMLWAQVRTDEQARLSAAHLQRYHALANYLYSEDRRTPHQARAIALRELPNLLHAVHAALDAGDADAVDLADSANHFLGRVFGLSKESEALVARAQATASEVGSPAWFLAQSNQGEKLLQEGRVTEAAQVFGDLLKGQGERPTYNRAATLARLGRAFADGGLPNLAAESQREAIIVLEKLDPTDDVKRLRGTCLTDLADSLALQGRYAKAREAYEASLIVKTEVGGDSRGEAVVLAQLGALALREGKPGEAEKRYRAALLLFQALGEPDGEAAAWHQLGMAFQSAGQWEEAERHYRESARITEALGRLARAAQTWNQLAIVNFGAGKLEAAENWFRKAIDGGKKLGDWLPVGRALSNLAQLLERLPGRLSEARRLAEEALAVTENLDPGAAEIWKTRYLLAQISEQEAELASDPTRQSELRAQARNHRLFARETKRNFAGTRSGLQQRAKLIFVAVAACTGEPHARDVLAQHQAEMRRGGATWSALADALDQVLAGEREEEALLSDLKLDQAMILEAILRGLEDPSTLSDLLPAQEAQALPPSES